MIFVYKHQERKEELKAAKGTFQTRRGIRRGIQWKIPLHTSSTEQNQNQTEDINHCDIFRLQWAKVINSCFLGLYKTQRSQFPEAVLKAVIPMNTPSCNQLTDHYLPFFPILQSFSTNCPVPMLAYHGIFSPNSYGGQLVGEDRNITKVNKQDLRNREEGEH